MKLGFRIWLLIIILILSLISIFITPNFLQKGVLITSVDPNSTSFEQGLRQGQVITTIDGKEITTLEDFTNALQGKYGLNESVKTIFQTKENEVILFSRSSKNNCFRNS